MAEKRETIQGRLQKMVWSRLVILVATGVVLFASGMLLSVVITNQKHVEENRKLLVSIVSEVYEKSVGFLLGEQVSSQCRDSLLCGRAPDRLRYLLYEQNAVSPITGNLVLNDKERNIVFNSFSEDEWNQYRNVYNKAICDNAFRMEDREVYTSVYYLSGDYSEYVFSRPIQAEGKVIGYVNLYLSGADWAKQLAVSNFEGIITDQTGRVIYSSRRSFLSHANKFFPEKESGTVYLGGERYWILGGELLGGQVKVYSLVYDPVNCSLFAIGSVIILFMGIGWFWLALSMTRAMAASNGAAVKKLVSEMDIIAHRDPEHRISKDTNDEFADIGVQINHMLDSIQELNRHNTELLQLKRTAEINQLTAQLNPHFLYNTLENLRNSLVFDPARADRMILNLTGILRYCIDDRQEETVFGEDMKYLDRYLDIQKCRYGERFGYEISLEEECYSCKVPKLILQPIVENSIKHGFKNKMDLHIWIDGYVQEGILHLSVTDDGTGMSLEEVEELNSHIWDGDSSGGHIGLKNIARRLFLQYGRESGIFIRDLEGEGLQVVVNIAQTEMS